MLKIITTIALLIWVLTVAGSRAQSGQLLYPPDGSISVEMPITFDWTDESANIWRLEASRSESFSTLVISQTLDVSQLTATVLSAFQVYHWRVRYGVNTGNDTTWGDYSPTGSFQTAIDGCCTDPRGDINGDHAAGPDIADLVYLVNYMFNGGPALPCLDEADIMPLASPDGSIDIADLVGLVNYMFNGGPAPGACPALIRIVDLNYGADSVHGIAAVVDTSRHRVVLWAKTNQWYVQPFTATPFTYIRSDGSWSSFTHAWDRMVALLVDSAYTPVSPGNDHPSMDAGVVSWDEYPDSSLRYLSWSDFRWRVKKGDLVGPGPNYFSDDTTNVWLDQDDRLHLKIDYRDGNWYCAEVVLDSTLGYGIYSFRLDSRVDSLDFNTILGGFLYETINQEIDFEISQRLADPFNAQFVIQPWYNPGNIEFFNMPDIAQTSHSMEWRADRIVFQSWNGHADTATAATLIHSWTYTGDDIPAPDGEQMIFNLYLYGGEPPVQGGEDEIIVKAFRFDD